MEHASLMGYAMAAITSSTPAIFSFGDTSSELLSLVQNSTELDCQLMVCCLNNVATPGLLVILFLPKASTVCRIYGTLQ